MKENKINLFIGLIGLVGFAITGAYMHLSYDHLHGMADGPRLMFRSAHIYVLWAALLNVSVGTSSFLGMRSFFPRLQLTTSIIIALVPLLIFCSFFLESTESTFYRPLTRTAIYFASLGVISQALLGYISCSRLSKMQ